VYQGGLLTIAPMATPIKLPHNANPKSGDPIPSVTRAGEYDAVCGFGLERVRYYSMRGRQSRAWKKTIMVGA